MLKKDRRMLMKKLSRKVVSALLVAAIFCMATISAAAVEEGNNEPENVITQMKYIVYDKDGNIRETGITPDPASRYTWEGITLYNGEWVKFLQVMIDHLQFQKEQTLRLDWNLIGERPCVLCLQRPITMQQRN